MTARYVLAVELRRDDGPEAVRRYRREMDARAAQEGYSAFGNEELSKCGMRGAVTLQRSYALPEAA